MEECEPTRVRTRLADATSDAALLEKTRVNRPPAGVATPSRTTPDPREFPVRRPTASAVPTGH